MYKFKFSVDLSKSNSKTLFCDNVPLYKSIFINGTVFGVGSSKELFIWKLFYLFWINYKKKE